MKLRIIASLAAMAALAGCASAAAPPHPARATSAPPRAVASVTGVYEPGAPASWAPVEAYAEATGTDPRLVLDYEGWYQSFPAAGAATAYSHGAELLIQIQTGHIPLAEIVAGKYDWRLRSYAAAVKASRHPVALSFDHEMNGGWYYWGEGHTAPAVYVAAWRHVVDVFRAAGASNVTWVWTVNSTNVARDSLKQWWPGPAYVNWVGIDGYYYRFSDTFASVFGATVSQIRTFTTTPVLIAETAVGTTPDRDAQITGLFAGMRADHLLGLVWFDEAQHKGVYHQDWRLENDPPALAAYRSAAKGKP
jgi:mannan endo-1,4-beta-mannosidase